MSADLLGLHDGHSPKFVKRYADLQAQITSAAERFMAEVEGGVYPSPEQSYNWSLK
ncbi:MAG: 3-methyl-2-oxobutanoate hydroxymethyltransferase [Cyanobacteria bacterium P01_D01_bin.56]